MQNMMYKYTSGRNHQRFFSSLSYTFIHCYFNGVKKNSFTVKAFQSCFTHRETKAPGMKSSFKIFFF